MLRVWALERVTVRRMVRPLSITSSTRALSCPSRMCSTANLPRVVVPQRASCTASRMVVLPDSDGPETIVVPRGLNSAVKLSCGPRPVMVTRFSMLDR